MFNVQWKNEEEVEVHTLEVYQEISFYSKPLDN